MRMSEQTEGKREREREEGETVIQHTNKRTQDPEVSAGAFLHIMSTIGSRQSITKHVFNNIVQHSYTFT